MPIVTVEIVAGADNTLQSDLAQSLADAVGRVLNSPPGQTWVRVRIVARDQYAENESSLVTSELPVFVALLKRKIPQDAELEREFTALTHAIARVVERPFHCVHVEYAPTAVGRLSLGGNVVQ